jgi:hypothetical protein
MAELADAADSKSAEGNLVGVRPPLPAPTESMIYRISASLDAFFYARTMTKAKRNAGCLPKMAGESTEWTLAVSCWRTRQCKLAASSFISVMTTPGKLAEDQSRRCRNRCARSLSRFLSTLISATSPADVRERPRLMNEIIDTDEAPSSRKSGSGAIACIRFSLFVLRRTSARMSL